MKVPELLVPAGDMEKLHVAVHFGADAVYIGGKFYNLRAGANNFTLEEMEKAVEYAHMNNVKVYLALNSYPLESQTMGLKSFLEKIRGIDIDAVIVADLGVVLMCMEIIPEISVHISTQMNIVNSHAVKLLEKIGNIKRVCLARELTLEDIRLMRENTDIELEVFVHGAMCVSYSGRCLLSAYFNHRSANFGDCSHPCRWKYVLMEETRPGEFFPVFEDESGGSFILSSKDLCMAEYIPDLCCAGIDAFKIEGRIKGVHYLACVTRLYRNILDAYVKSPEKFEFKRVWRDELFKINSRGYFPGFYFGRPSTSGQLYTGPPYDHRYAIAGVVINSFKNEEKYEILVKTCFRRGDILELVSPDIRSQSFTVDKMMGLDGRSVDLAKPNEHVVMDIPFCASSFDILRCKKS